LGRQVLGSSSEFICQRPFHERRPRQRKRTSTFQAQGHDLWGRASFAHASQRASAHIELRLLAEGESENMTWESRWKATLQNPDRPCRWCTHLSILHGEPYSRCHRCCTWNQVDLAAWSTATVTDVNALADFKLTGYGSIRVSGIMYRECCVGLW